MRVLLVQAFTAVDMELVFPLGLAWIARHLEGHQVSLFDVNLHRERPFEALSEAVQAFRPDVVGVSFRNMKVGMPHLHTDDIAPQRQAVDCIRAAAPSAVVVGGGTAFSLYSLPMMRRIPGIDIGVWGEAEIRFPQLLEHLSDPGSVPGVWWRDGAEVRWSGPPPQVDFARLPPPRRDLVDLEPYKASSFVSVGVQAKRGCALRCVHCSDTFLAGNRVRLRDPSQVVDEVEELVRDHGVKQMFFCDQQFNIPYRHAMDICDQILARKLDLRWSAWFNEHTNALPDALVSRVKRAGCGLLSFSPDHVDDRILAGLDKNFRQADLWNTVQVARRHDMDVEYSFFLNVPGDDLAAMARIFTFLARARWVLGPRLRTFSLLLAQPIRIYPHTRLHQMAVEAGIILPQDDLVEGRYWNPGHLRLAVSAIQGGAHLLYKGRQTWRSLRGRTFDSVVRK